MNLKFSSTSEVFIMIFNASPNNSCVLKKQMLNIIMNYVFQFKQGKTFILVINLFFNINLNYNIS